MKMTLYVVFVQGVQQNSGHFIFGDFLASLGARIKTLFASLLLHRYTGFSRVY